MRQALRRNAARQAVSIPDTIPAPVGGLDTQSPLAAMPPESAILLENCIPRPGYVELRRGFRPFATGLLQPVQTLMSWRGPTSAKLLAAAGTNIFDATAGGIMDTPLATGFTSARWNYVNVANAASDHYIVAVNGQDSPRLFNGTAFSTATFTGTGIDPSKWIDVTSIHNRLWFIERDSMRAWYLQPLAIQGAAAAFPLDEVFTKGGSLLAVGTWSSAAGLSMAARLVFVTTEGEIAVYEGIDPSDAELFTLVGVYQVDTPIGRRCLVKNGSDLGVLTSGGLVPLSQVLSLDRAAQRRVAFTQNVATLFQELAALYGSIPGWQTLAWARGQLVLVNVPQVTDGRALQLVMDTVTGSWARWNGQPACCWASFNERLFFGTSAGTVMEANVGRSDDTAPIVYDIQPAFNYFGRRGQQKRFTMIRPVLRSSQPINVSVEMLTDFEVRVPVAIPTVVDNAQSAWGVAKWGMGKWAGSRRARNEWTGANGLGVCGTPRMRISTFGANGKGTIELVGVDVLYEVGGGL
ncbi:hypothetical protein [Geminicoccus harenae]|uniref:hypothetical protein n=1 Tax=Geminicoccus harenae TaxID=2498453 RepID=UPI00168AF3A2|nr:hypothetical protein [Geminicoccus harenae]